MAQRSGPDVLTAHAFYRKDAHLDPQWNQTTVPDAECGHRNLFQKRGLPALQSEPQNLTAGELPGGLLASLKGHLADVCSFCRFVSLFPLLMRLLPPDSPQLAALLQALPQADLLWSPYGLR